jgi:large conductance mechanosensitive channel
VNDCGEAWPAPELPIRSPPENISFNKNATFNRGTKMLDEFKQFAMRGNVVDMAVGIIIGGAFGKIISSFVADVIMPPIGMLMGNVDFSQLFINLSDVSYESLALAQEAGAPTINYGVFINTVLDFLIVAFAIFMVIRGMNKMKKKEEEKPAEPAKPSEEAVLLTEIRDALRNRG